MAKKTRLSGIVDNSTMGVDIEIGSEMEISRNTSKHICKALLSASKNGLKGFKASVRHVSGTLSGDSMLFYLNYPSKYPKKKDEELGNVQYEFKKQGSKFFLNVRGNPTALVSGSNDIPVLIMGFDYEGLNRPTITFKYMNRMLYAILDTLLEQYGFSWAGLDKKRLVDGDISIHRYQVAWYSNDLGEHRDAVCLYLRKVFGGIDATSDRVVNVGDALGITAMLWRDNVNITLETRSGDKKYFGLTFYAKDQEPGYRGNKNRLESLIRWDCTLHYAFLANNRIKTVRALEERFVETCEKDGYDFGFIRFLADKVEKRLKLPYLLGMSIAKFRVAVNALEEVEGKNHIKVAKHWLEHGKTFERDEDAAKFFEMQPSNYSSVKTDLLKLGIDISFPRRTHDAILETRVLSMRTADERSDAVVQKKGSNKVIPLEELEKRETEMLAKINNSLDTSRKGTLKVRRFTPVKIKPQNFWIYRKDEQ